MKTKRPSNPSQSRHHAFPASGLSADRRTVIERSIARAHRVGKDFPTTKPPRLGEPGFSQVELVVVLAVLIGIAAFGAYCFHLGSEHKQAEWDAKQVADIRASVARDQDVSDAIKEVHDKSMLAEQRAGENEAKLKGELREARRNGERLAVCEEQGPAASALAGAPDGAPVASGSGLRPAGVAARGARIRLLWRTVGLHDGVFTGVDGEPLFPDSAQFARAPERADTASPYELDELIEVDGENGRALSKCLRWVNDVELKLQAAEKAWDKKGRQ